MAHLQPIARAYSDSALKEHLCLLKDEFRAIQRKSISATRSRSDSAPLEVAAIAKRCLELQAVRVSDNYAWAIRESPRADAAWVRSLTNEATDSLLPLFNAGAEEISAGCELAERPELTTQLVGELQSVHGDAQKTIRLAIENAFAIRNQHPLRRIVASVARFVSGTRAR